MALWPRTFRIQRFQQGQERCQKLRHGAGHLTWRLFWSIPSWASNISFGCGPPHRIPVTTRIITFLGSGIPINLHLPLLLWGATSNISYISPCKVYLKIDFAFFLGGICDRFPGGYQLDFTSQDDSSYFQFAKWNGKKKNLETKNQRPPTQSPQSTHQWWHKNRWLND